MTLELTLGVMNGIKTSDYGNPYRIIRNIESAKKNNVDIFVGPEWSLTYTPGVFNKNSLEGKKAKTVVETIFNAHDYIEYAPRDAKAILMEAIEESKENFIKIPQIPHSKREYKNILNKLLEISKDSDMVIYPGTGMFYDKNRVLYNHMPVINKGKIIKNLYKFNDGLGSRFNLENKLRLYPSQTSKSRDYSKSFGDSPIISVFGLKTAVEICADYGMLKELGINYLDLQIMSSCGNFSEVPAVNNNGYIVLVDGIEEKKSKVIKRYTQKIKPVKTSQSMDIYKLKFDI